MISQIDELISCCTQEIAMREYCDQHQKIIRKGWEELRVWMEARGHKALDEETADQYCGEFLGSRKYADLTEREKKRIRSVRMLVSYQKDGDFEYRYSTADRSLRGESGKAMQQYMDYLRDVLALRASTLSNKLFYLLLFNRHLENSGCPLDKITAETMLDFHRSQNFTLAALHNCNSTLKLFLSYAFDTHVTPRNLSVHILPDGYRSNCKLPTTYTDEEISRVVAAVDRSSAIGKRDYVVLLLAAEYAWRASDIVNFEFSQIDWDKNRISLTQIKTDVPNDYPLLSSVGNAIIDYLKNGRPATDSKAIIVSAESSKRGQPLHEETIHSIVARYMCAADIDNWRQKKHGPHSLRHSLASNMLRNNVSMPVIGTVLGHQSAESTKVYLSIDIDKLRLCPLPMPIVRTAHYRGWQS